MTRFALSLITLVALFLSACQTTSNYQISAELLEKVGRGNLGVASNSEEQERCIVPNSISGASFPLSENLVTEEPLGKTLSKGMRILRVNQDDVSNKKELKDALAKPILEDKGAVLFLVEQNNQTRFVTEKTGCVVVAFASLLGSDSKRIITSGNENKIETLENNDGVASELSALQEDCPAASLQPEITSLLSNDLIMKADLGENLKSGQKLLRVGITDVSDKNEFSAELRKFILLDKEAILFLVEQDGNQKFVTEKTKCIIQTFANLIDSSAYSSASLQTENNTKAAEIRRVATDKVMPVISIFSSTADDRRGSIRGKVTDNIAVAEVRVDGAVVPLKSDGSFEWQGFVPSDGLSVAIEAIDTAGLSAMQQVRLERRQLNQAAGPTFVRLDPFRGKAAKKNRNALALIIGVSDYERTPDPAIYADKDAQYFNDYAAIKLGVPDNNIFTLLNQDADEVSIKKAVKNWLLRMSVKDKTDVYVFFAGHGLASSDGSNMFLLPYDGDPELLEDSAIDRKQLFADIQAISPRSVTVFLDSCYSGGTRAGGTLVANLRPIAIRAKEQNVPDGFTILSAAKGDQTSQSLEEAKHGLFSYFLMRGLEGDADTNNDNQITAGELHSFVTDKVERQSGFKQTPDLQGDAGRVLVRFQ